MGCGASTATPEAAASAAIDKSLKQEARTSNPLIKALLLGTGASGEDPPTERRASSLFFPSAGKTTVCKQMRLLFLNGYSDKDARMFREPIVFNLLRNMALVAEYAARWSLAFEERLQPHATRLLSMQLTIGSELDKETGAAMAALWRDKAALEVMARANETTIDDSHRWGKKREEVNGVVCCCSHFSL